jgi:hypothetical protein
VGHYTLNKYHLTYIPSHRGSVQSGLFAHRGTNWLVSGLEPLATLALTTVSYVRTDMRSPYPSGPACRPEAVRRYVGFEYAA